MSDRSHSYVAVHLCHQQTALVANSQFYLLIRGQYFCTYLCFVIGILYRDTSGLHQLSPRHVA